MYFLASEIQVVELPDLVKPVNKGKLLKILGTNNRAFLPEVISILSRVVIKYNDKGELYVELKV